VAAEAGVLKRSLPKRWLCRLLPPLFSTACAVEFVPPPNLPAIAALIVAVFVIAAPIARAQTPTGTIGTIIGGNNRDGGPATNAIVDPQGIESHGPHLYIADTNGQRIRKVDGNTGLISTVAGTGHSGFSGDGGPALAAEFFGPGDVAFDPSGRMYIAEITNRRVRRVDLAGNIQTVAGNGGTGYQGDNVPATQTSLSLPYGITLDSGGNLYIADFSNRRVRKVDTSGLITTFAGTGVSGYSGDGGPATEATLSGPTDVWMDPNDRLYISDYLTSAVRRVDPSGIITTVAGNGIRGFFGDGGPATSAWLSLPFGVIADSSNNLIVLDSGNYRVRRVDATQTINTIAGNGVNSNSGNGGPATDASLYQPVGITADSSGNIYVSGRGATLAPWSLDHTVRKIDPSGIITLVAGISDTGDGGLASEAVVDPYGIRFGRGSQLNHLYIADRRNNQIRRVNTATGIISLVAGSGASGFGGDNGSATIAQLRAPRGVTSDTNGNVWIADTDNNRIRKVSTSGVITTVAGTGISGFSGDGGSATSAKLNAPYAVDIDSFGNLYIADRFNNRIRKVTPAGTITTIAGNGTVASTGNGGPASQASLGSPMDVLLAPDGSIYIAEGTTNQVRKIIPEGIILGVAGTGTAGFAGDGGPALSAHLRVPAVIALDPDGNLFIGDQQNNRTRRVDAVTGIITTVAGTGVYGNAGDGGAATNAELQPPSGLAADTNGDLYIAQTDSGSVRKVIFEDLPDTPTTAATATPTSTPSNTPTYTSTWTRTNTPTNTRTHTPTHTPPPTLTQSPSRTATFSPTRTATRTASHTRTATQTFTSTPSQTPTRTQTLVSTTSPTHTPTRTATFTPTSTASHTRTFTPTQTSSRTPTPTSTQTSSRTPTSTRTPSMTPTSGPDGFIGGLVFYSDTSSTVSSVVVDLVPGGGTTQTGSDGTYTFDPIEEQDWSIEPSLSGDFSACLDVSDAMYVLEAVVGTRQLSIEQQLAADVSGNGTITAHDASLILQVVLSLIPTLPVIEACSSAWIFMPDPPELANQTVIDPQISSGDCIHGAIELHPLSGRVGARNFRAILFGDVNNTWLTNPGCPGDP
jgi:hypothetical protein